MKYHIISEVMIEGIGKVKDEHTQEITSDNVFGRVLEYHEYMHKFFPNCEFKLIKAEAVR